MGLSTQLTCDQLREIIMNELNPDKRARELEEQVQDGEEIFNPVNTSSGLNTVLSTIKNTFERECLDEAVRLLNAHSIRQSTDEWVRGHKPSI